MKTFSVTSSPSSRMIAVSTMAFLAVFGFSWNDTAVANSPNCTAPTEIVAPSNLGIDAFTPFFQDQGGNTIFGVQDTDTTCANPNGSNGFEVYYGITAPTRGEYSFRVIPASGSLGDIQLYAFTDCSDITGTCLAGSDNPGNGASERIDIALNAGDTVTFAVDLYSADPVGQFEVVAFDFEAYLITAPPSNYICSRAEDIDTFTQIPYADTGNNSIAGNDYSGAACANGDGNELVWSTTPFETDEFDITLTPNAFRGSLYVVTDCSDLSTCIAGGVSASPGAPVTVTVTLQRNTQYFIIADSDAAAGTGPFDLTIDYTPGPPNNDTCASPRVIDAVPYNNPETSDLGSDDFTSLCGVNLPGIDAVYEYTPTEDFNAIFTVTSNDVDFAIAVTTACGSSIGGDCVAFVDDFNATFIERLATPVLLAGQTYYIHLDSEDANVTGDYTFRVEQRENIPANDACGNATVVASLPYTEITTNESAFDDVEIPGSCASELSGNDIFWSFDTVAGDDLTAQIATSDLMKDVALYAFTDCSDPAGSLIACDADRDLAQVTFTAPGGTVFFAADGVTYADAGEMEFSLFETIVSPNVDCTSPLVVPSLPYVAQGSTINAGDNFRPPLPGCTSQDEGADVVYEFQVTTGPQVNITVDFVNDNILGNMYLASDCNDIQTTLVTGGCAGGANTLNFVTDIAPGTYYLVVSGVRSVDEGIFDIEIEEGPFEPYLLRFNTTHSFIDISQPGSGGQLIPAANSNDGIEGLGDDDFTAVPLDIGFAYNYYGQDYTQVYVSSNGYISFTGSQDLTTPSPNPQATSAPNNVIIAFGTDLDPGPAGAGDVWFLSDPVENRFIIQWQAVRAKTASELQTFQIILCNDIDFNEPAGIQYQNVTVGNARVGVKNQDGSQRFFLRDPAVLLNRSFTILLTSNNQGECYVIPTPTNTPTNTATVTPTPTITPTPLPPGQYFFTDDIRACFSEMNVIGEPVLASGSTVGLGVDEFSDLLPIGFGFNFFGEDYNSVIVSSNGFLSFARGGNESSSQGTLPNVDAPNAAIYGMWDNLDATNASLTTFFDQTNDRFIATWDDVEILDDSGVAGGQLDFQIMLCNGDGTSEPITVTYRNINDPNGLLADAVVGIESTDGLEAVVNPVPQNILSASGAHAIQFVSDRESVCSCELVPTVTPSPTLSPTNTFTPTITPTPTDTPTVTPSPTPTNTYTPSNTPTPTDTPRVTPTPMPGWEIDDNADFCWFNLRPIGQPVPASEALSGERGMIDDDRTVSIPLTSFKYSFFGVEYDRVVIGSNGLLSFESNGRGANLAPPSGNSIPNTAIPNNAIFALWADFKPGQDLQSNGFVSYYEDVDNRRFIVTWDDVLVKNAPSRNSITFQVILYDGANTEFEPFKVQFQGSTNSSNPLTGLGNSVIGAEGPNPNAGIQNSFFSYTGLGQLGVNQTAISFHPRNAVTHCDPLPLPTESPTPTSTPTVSPTPAGTFTNTPTPSMAPTNTPTPTVPAEPLCAEIIADFDASTGEITVDYNYFNLTANPQTVSVVGLAEIAEVAGVYYFLPSFSVDTADFLVFQENLAPGFNSSTVSIFGGPLTLTPADQAALSGLTLNWYIGMLNENLDDLTCPVGLSSVTFP